MRGRAGARRDGRSRCEPFDAIAVEGTRARPSIARAPRHADVTKLWMEKSMYESAVDEQTDAHAGSDGHIGEILESSRRAPTALGEGRSVHVGVEADRDAEVRQAGHDRRVAPTRLWRRCDPPVARRSRAAVDGAEGGNSKRVNRTVRFDSTAEFGVDLGKGRRRV